MKPTVEIKRNEDGLVRSYQDDFDWEGDFIWADGNYACDCNRELFFARAAKEPDPEWSDCSRDRYSVRITDPDGVILYEDGTWK